MKKILKNGMNMAAVIEISTDFIKMRISSLKQGKVLDIDNLEQFTNLGHEIFNNNKISFECLQNISDILKNYLDVLNEYRVKNYRVITSTFFKEAQNYEYAVDQLKVQNNVNLEILEDGFEKSLIYSEIKKHIGIKDKVIKNTMVAYVGASSLGIAVCSGGDVIFTQNIKIGSLKLHDILGQVQDQTSDFGTVLEEYIDRMLGRINLPINKNKIGNLIIAGSQIDLIEKFCGNRVKGGEFIVDSEKLRDFYETVNKMTSKLISEKYNISLREAEVFFVSLAIYRRVISMTNSKNITSLRVELIDEVIFHLLDPKSRSNFEKSVIKNTISCAETIADHYNCDIRHRNATYKYATLIFDKMKKIHGLNNKKRLLLEVAIVLHEVGYYVNSKSPRISTFDIIKNLEIYGLNPDEVNMVANIAKYDEFTVPRLADEVYGKLSSSRKIAVSKMTAIFRLANALDKAKKQKFKDINLKLTHKNLVITVESDKNAYLEKWAFNQCVPFFEEVFGISPQLVIKTLLF